MEKYKVISLFSGAGGMDLGFVQAGFEIVWANDVFEEAVETYSKNIGNHITIGDITKIKSEDMPDDIDLVIGGFPCQGFSVANIKRSMKDERNFLYKEMLRVIKDKKPKFFVAENVKGILSMEQGKVFEMIKSDFEELGYEVDARLLNAAEYGVPQARERVVIIGNRLGIENPYPKPSHWVDSKRYETKEGLKDPITTQEAIGFLSDVPLSVEPIVLDSGLTIYNHMAATNVYDTFWGRKYEVDQIELCEYLRRFRKSSGMTNMKVAQYVNLPQTLVDHWFRNDNESGSIPRPHEWWMLKECLHLDDTYDEQITTIVEKEIKFEQSLRITNWDRPSDTITATSPEIHVNRERRLSARECAILQTFPMDFVFYGSLNDIYKQIGNAVPVLLAKQIAEGIKNSIDDYEKKKD